LKFEARKVLTLVILFLECDTRGRKNKEETTSGAGSSLRTSYF